MSLATLPREMARLTDRELAEYLDIGTEFRGVEFKPSRPVTDRRAIARIAIAALGMSNRRDGGTIIIGVEDENNTLRPTGVDPQYLPGWNHNDLSAKLAEYADPYITFELQQLTLSDATFVVLNVDEFDEIPVLARREFEGIIRRGALYVRSFGKPETTEVPTQAEMRELLDLATSKSVRRLLRDAQAAGLLDSLESRDVEQYEAQARGVFGDPT